MAYRFGLLTALLVGLATSCGGTPHADFASNELTLTGEEPEAAEPAWPAAPEAPKRQQCLAGGACEPATPSVESTEPLDPDRIYAVGVNSRDPARGPENAPVTLVVFSDYQCPFCRQFELLVNELGLRYSSQLRLVWKDLPLESHLLARPAALLGRAAYAKGGNALFWRVHDELFVRQAELSEASLKRLAERHGLAWPPSAEHEPELQATFRQVLELNVRATPTAFINGRPVIGLQPRVVYERLIEAELAGGSASSSPLPSSPPPSSTGQP
jgi:protein-disulfide isomerase